MKTRFHVSIGLLIVMLAAVSSGAGDLRFTAVYEDGSVKTSNSLGDSLIRATSSGWGPSSLRYLRDWHVKIAPKGPYVQFANGDILHGQVISITPAKPGSGQKERMVAKIAPPLFSNQSDRQVTVRFDRVARIVSRASAQRQMQPGTLWLNEDPLTRFSAIRWNKDGFMALSDKGMIRASYSELQEYHATNVDTWAAVLLLKLCGGQSGPRKSLAGLIRACPGLPCRMAWCSPVLSNDRITGFVRHVAVRASGHLVPLLRDRRGGSSS